MCLSPLFNWRVKLNTRQTGGPVAAKTLGRTCDKTQASETSPRSHSFNPGPTLTKELTFSSNIGQHDLDTKNKQIQQWIEKKYKVQITIKKANSADEPEKKMVSENRPE